MQTKSAGELSKSFWSERYTCSESIVNALWDIWGEKKESCPTKYASAFCGGIGKCKEDICGALTGGVIIAGALFGREKGGEDIGKACAISREYRNRFLKRFHNTNCRSLCGSIEDKDMDVDDCKDLTVKAADILNEVIKEVNAAIPGEEHFL